MTGASLAVAMIGQALAQARGLVTKHAVKQVDRLMSNAGIDVWDSFVRWVPQQVGTRPDILVAMDWTEFAHDGQSTLVLSLVTGHGRAAPLIWLTVWQEVPRTTVDWTPRKRTVSAEGWMMATDETQRPGAAERPQESGAAAPGRGGRMSRQRKTAAVLRLLRGEDLETVSRSLGVTAATLSGWRDAFLSLRVRRR